MRVTKGADNYAYVRNVGKMLLAAAVELEEKVKCCVSWTA